jgi:hypothetical protein
MGAVGRIPTRIEVKKVIFFLPVLFLCFVLFTGLAAGMVLTAFTHFVTAIVTFLFRFVSRLSGQSGDSLIGDIEERYVLTVKTKGRQTATRWFYREAAHSFCSLGFDALKRISGIEKLFRRIG